MQIAAVKETATDERRLALAPKAVAMLQKLGLDVIVETKAGATANYSDADFETAGAKVVARQAALEAADILVSVQTPAAGDLDKCKSGTVVIGSLDTGDDAFMKALRDKKLTAFAMQQLPRISRAQDMDILSSQATLSGYAAAVRAAAKLPRIFPLFMTAAGTITPARVLVLGAGVAGLQAIATCRRLGAVVEVFDVRPAVREQVESLGAKFVEVGVESASAETSGGYARALGSEEAERQRQVIAEHAKESDVVIATAAIPNQKAPLLLTAAAVSEMKAGAVVIDLAAPSGGNCELTKLGEEVTVNDVLIYGPKNLAAEMAGQASQLYAHNLARFIGLMVKDGKFEPDWSDEILRKTCVVRDGETFVAPESVGASA